MERAVGLGSLPESIGPQKRCLQSNESNNFVAQLLPELMLETPRKFGMIILAMDIGYVWLIHIFTSDGFDNHPSVVY